MKFKYELKDMTNDECVTILTDLHHIRGAKYGPMPSGKNQRYLQALEHAIASLLTKPATKPQHDRTQELLEANNRYLERARAAEAKVAALEAEKSAVKANSNHKSETPLDSTDRNLWFFPRHVHTYSELARIRSGLNAVGYDDADTSTLDLVFTALREIGDTRKILIATGHDCTGASLDRLVDRAIDVERTRRDEATAGRDTYYQRANFLEARLETISKAVKAEFDKAEINPF